MKNTDRLPEDMLHTLRYMRTGDGEDKRKDDDINVMTPNEIFKEVLSYKGIIGYEYFIKKSFISIYGIDDEDLLISRADEYRRWCSWTLDEDEILHAISDVGIPDSEFGLNDGNRENFISEIADRFKKALSIMAEEWEYELRGCVVDTIEEWREKKI